MFIKLDFKSETQKAYQLQNGSWIPKSILDNRGLTHPYYKIKDWWLNIQLFNVKDSVGEYNFESGKEITQVDKNNSIKVLQGIEPIHLNFRDIPKDVKDDWTKYWKRQYSDIGSTSSGDYGQESGGPTNIFGEQLCSPYDMGIPNC